MVDRVGQNLGNYRLVRLLGQGGFAEVYLGEHVYLDTQAAIKVLQTQLARENIEQFRQEARTIARLEHPHIVRVLDFGVEGTTPFLVMMYAPGGTLRHRYPKGTQLPLPLIVSYVKQVADALQYAHEQRLVHRDVKPENILLGRSHELLLSDFGIAVVTESSRYQSTQDMVGTMAYMSPEQIHGKPRAASDQYSLGIVVYEWLSGDRPFHGSLTEIVAQHLTVPPPPLHGKLSTISPDVEHVVLTALEKDPQNRFATVQAFATAFERACQLSHSRPVAPSTELFSSGQSSQATGGMVGGSPSQNGFCGNCGAALLPNKMCSNPSCQFSPSYTRPSVYGTPTTPVLRQTESTTASSFSPQTRTSSFSPPPRRRQKLWFLIGMMVVVLLLLVAGVGAYQLGIMHQPKAPAISTPPLSPPQVKATPTLDAKQAIQSADFSTFIQGFAILMAQKDYTTIQSVTDTQNFQEIPLFAEGQGNWKDMDNQLLTGNMSFIIQYPPITATQEGYGLKAGNSCTMYGKKGFPPFININASDVQAIVGTSMLPNFPPNSATSQPNTTVFIFELPSEPSASWLWRAVTLNNKSCLEQ